MEERVITVPESCDYVPGENTQNLLDSIYWEDPFVPYTEITARLLFWVDITYGL